ncbi:hypothetical protein PHRODO_124 [Bacillus phage Phrodo]|uniref:hypothetical protein n=1 Tax=Bacillus phage Phrodo TaxID=1805953 RepID=UPI0007A77511|nr:hypothetical protein BI003_gp124 [Bacillus phage Phrodo]AMW62165.1 hypothetical protein PHRODO_124 [Bacillus phage Phrodo]UGO48936.1 hypothetical protein JARJAR_122 [Bacillus phage vB_BanH_JarJar]UGO50426.1 hypothetical protein RONSWANSON_120 [Bacillus phage vB_BanH_RonSwanson]
MIHNKDDVKAVIEELEVSDHMDIVGFVNIWSNGVKIRRYQGQDKLNYGETSKDKGYKKMVAILVEVEEEDLF